MVGVRFDAHGGKVVADAGDVTIKEVFGVGVAFAGDDLREVDQGDLPLW